MRDTRRHLAPRDQEAVLREIYTSLLAEEGQSVPDWGIVGPQIEAEIDQQSSELLAEASNDYNAFEMLRLRAVRAYERPDPAVCVLAGAIAGYLILVTAGPAFLPSAVAVRQVGLTPWILAVLVVMLAVGWVLWRRKRVALMRSVHAASLQWIDALRDQVLRPFIVEKRNDEVRNPRLLETRISKNPPPRLVERSDPRRLVVTEAMNRVDVTARNIRSGSLGVSGPRGVGKSTILQFFGTDVTAANAGELRLVVSAPVDYQPQDFIIHLFSQLCEAVLLGPADKSALPEKSRVQREQLAENSRLHLEQLRYLRTYTTSWSASLTPRSFLTLARGYQKQRTEQPITLPALVGSFRDYSEKVASWYRTAYGEDGRVIIGIDEVDKIRDSERAEAFLNDVKAIFGVPGCLYLVTLSEDALASFARRTPSIRTAFDTAFDELVPVGPMTYEHSEEMLFKRVTGVPRPFIALCHVLAGGLPRDLVRVARALVDVRPAEGEKPLPDTARDLIDRELESLRQASVRPLAENGAPGWLLAAMHDRQWSGSTPQQLKSAGQQLAGAAQDTESDSVRQLCQDLVVSLSFHRTALDLFTAGQDRLMASLKDKRYAIIDDLAAARYAQRVSSGPAHRLLEQYRLQHVIGRDNGIS